MKRIFDVVLALVLIIVLLPVLITVAAVVYYSHGRPILFAQKRLGFQEKVFTIYKFRTMRNTKTNGGELLSDEARLTHIGKIMRKLSLDELPQLWNVLKGEMSFVGPRPLLVEYLELYTAEQRKRHKVKPGITGWAQIHGRNAIRWEEKFKLDVWYVENQSFLLDIKILCKTFAKVLKQEGIAQNAHVTMEKFNGYN